MHFFMIDFMLKVVVVILPNLNAVLVKGGMLEGSGFLQESLILNFLRMFLFCENVEACKERLHENIYE